MAAKAKLTYFQGRGRAGLVRLTLAAAGVEFEDVFVKEKEHFQKLKDDGELLFMQLPLLEIDGLKIVQSGAIVRYIAHKHGLMGTDPVEQTMIDTLFEGSRDFIMDLVSLAFRSSHEERFKAQESIKKKAKEQFLPIFEKVYKKSTSGFLVGDSLSLADLAWLELLLALHEVEPQFAITFPSVAAFTTKITSLPQINAFINGPQRQSAPDDAYVATVCKVLDWN